MTHRDASPSVDNDNYRLVWRSPPAGWFIRHRATAPDACPFLVPDGIAGSAVRQRMHHGMLMAGLLYAWTEVAAPVRREARPATELAWVRWLFNQATRRGRRLSAANVVLALARRARAQHGLLVSTRVLFGGCEMYRDLEPLPPLPGPAGQASAVRIALVEEVWRLLARAPHVDVESACETIVDAYEAIPPSALGPAARESVDFAYCAALHLLARRDRLRTFSREAAVRLHAGGLRDRVLVLLNDASLDLPNLVGAPLPSNVVPLVH